MKESKKGIGLKYAWAGLITTLKYERNVRIHLFAAIIVLIFSLLLKINRFEWLFIILAISLVLISELINSVIERLIDYLKPERNIHAKEIKDISAGVVLLATFTAVIIGIIIFLPKIVELL